MLSHPQLVIHLPPETPLTPQLRPAFPKHRGQLSSREPLTSKEKSKPSASETRTVDPFLAGQLNSSAYASALDSCACPEFGKQVHAHLLKNGFNGREFVQTKLLKFYGKWGSVEDLLKVFDKMPERNLYSYTAIVDVLLDNGLHEKALTYFERLLFEDIVLEFFVFPVALKICSSYGGVELGRQLHCLLAKTGFFRNNYVGNALIDMYGKCGSLSCAQSVFDKMLMRDCVSWNSMVTACASNGRPFQALGFLEQMAGKNDLRPNSVTWSALIGGFAQNGHDEEAIGMLSQMIAAGFEPNARVLASVLPACARLRKLRLGKEIYGYITRHRFMSSPYIVSGLINLYRRCGAMESAVKVFNRFSMRDTVSFNTMITGFCENGEILRAKELFQWMENEGKLKDLDSWNSMISGYADNFIFDEALSLFVDLMADGGIEPDSFTLGSILKACTDSGFLKFGKAVHSYCISKGFQSNSFVAGALVDMYCHFRDLEAAHKAFCPVKDKDIVIWNTLVSGYATCNQIESIQSVIEWMKDDGFEPNIYTLNGILAGYVENGHYEPALKLFSDLQTSNLKPDIHTVGIAIPACSRLATIERGKQIHAYVVRCGFEQDVYTRATLIDMYVKCGNMKYANLVHSGTKYHDLVTQNAMLNGYAMHGHGDDGISFFREMLLNGFTPDSVTFLAVLSSCVHAGSVETGLEFFNLMDYYGVKRTIKHYTCMVDLLSRGGRLTHAYQMIEKMPERPDAVIWGALLGGCIIHGDVDMGEIAANKLIELEPDDPGSYVMLANLYAYTGKWHELRKTRQQMKEERLHKNPGCSWIEDRNERHVFMAQDRSHKRAEEIYEMLDDLTAHMRSE